ncbi:MAG: VOC family protein [Pseudomonadota bacterium]|nr:VOC family protein [Pseudomonadota bacterium]
MPSIAEAQGAADSLLARVDHLVFATPDLNRGVDEIERLLGIRASAGGPHPGRGTRNALVALGPHTYLEIMAPDPDQPPPSTPRPFGLDLLTHSRLVAWAANGHDLEQLRETAGRNGVELGMVLAGSRQRPDGVLLRWKFTDPWWVVADGLVPFFIDWGRSPHPAQIAAKGATLLALRAEHPHPKRVQVLLRGISLEMPVEAGPTALIATIDSPRGRVELR